MSALQLFDAEMKGEVGSPKQQHFGEEVEQMEEEEEEVEEEEEEEEKAKVEEEVCGALSYVWMITAMIKSSGH